MKRFVTTVLSAGMVLISALAAGAPQPSFSRAPRGLEGPGDGERLDRLAELLALSEEQRAEWERALEEHRTAVQPLVDERRTLRLELQEALERDDPDASGVGILMLAIHDIRAKLRAERESLHERLSAILDEEQRIKWETLQEARRGPRQRGHREAAPPF